ncbi:MAG: hypothetical protein JWN03_4337 [Nocardia sp.]|uniref:WXG100 family type VII secretion target n=1 Tax=Nocardia sp. TaxID=1821 RepID=UPI002624AEF9|nr:WXG100 family type VII secretion target [Nocardia sp.]MCU1644062.1 hypothetical protein [Nocardia sp.]
MSGNIQPDFGHMDGHMDRLNGIANGVQTSVDALGSTNDQLMNTFSGQTAAAYSEHHRALNQKIQNVQEHLAKVRAAGQTALGTGGTLHAADIANAKRFTI